ncbi:MAG: PIN domain-containing protein [Ilumatobacter sp.]
MSYLVDTSVLTRLANATVRERLRDLAAQGLHRATITDLEIGFSARNGDEWDGLSVAVGAFDLVEIHEHHFQRARHVQRLLADKGLKGRKIPDLLIAAIAESTSLNVLHYDADFGHIASITGQSTEWIVARGTID